MSPKWSKTCADVIDGDAGDRDVALADAGLGADALGDPPGVLEQGVQHGPVGRLAAGQLVGLLHLAGDLALADDQAVEAGGDAEQVPDGVRVAVFVEVRPDLVGRQAVELGEEVGDPWPASGLSPGQREVQLDAVAGAEDDGLAAGAGRSGRGRGQAARR